MATTNRRVITFHYTLTDPEGNTLDSSIGQEPLAFLEAGGQIIPGLEKVVQTLKVGEKKRVVVPAAEAYGERDERFVLKVPRDELPEGELQVGDELQAGGDDESHPLLITEITDAYAVLDGNHPLAGMNLTFDVELTGIREATAEELSHGHVHGPGGHH